MRYEGSTQDEELSSSIFDMSHFIYIYITTAVSLFVNQIIIFFNLCISNTNRIPEYETT